MCTIQDFTTQEDLVDYQRPQRPQDYYESISTILVFNGPMGTMGFRHQLITMRQSRHVN